MSDKCPECGAEAKYIQDDPECECFREKPYPIVGQGSSHVINGPDCLCRQLAQAKAENERLKENWRDLSQRWGRALYARDNAVCDVVKLEAENKRLRGLVLPPEAKVAKE